MKIAFVVYSHYSRDARVRRYTECLARKGFKVDVICLEEDYCPNDSNITLHKYILPRRRFGKFWYIAEYSLFFIYTSIVLTLNYLHKKYKIVHINNIPDILVFTAIIPKIFGAKVILDMHDPMPELYMSKYHEDENCFMVKLLKLLEGICFVFADKIITANESFRSIFLKRNRIDKDKISVILNCPDPRIFKSINNQQLIINNRGFTLLYMGTLDERFGLDIAFEAIPGLVKIIPNLMFVIIPKLENEGKYYKNLKLRIMNYELNNYIEILNPLPLEKIAKILQTANIGIVLAKNGVFMENIFPVKLLEFVQMEIPVIATKTKILKENFNKNQIFFLRENTSVRFKEAVIKLYNNKILRQNLSHNAKKYLKRFNWEIEENRYQKLINVLIKLR